MARKIGHDGQIVSLKPLPNVKMKRVKFRNLESPYLVGKVKTQSGNMETVNMGPKSEYDGVDLGKGAQVKLLVRQGRIDGRDALIARTLARILRHSTRYYS